MTPKATAHSPSARPRRRPLCRQGDHPDPVGTKASSFSLRTAPSPVPQIQAHRVGGTQRAQSWGLRLHLTLMQAPWEGTMPHGSLPNNPPERTMGCRGRSASGGRTAQGLKHLPRGRALRGDRDLRGNRRGPETEKEARAGPQPWPSTPCPPAPREGRPAPAPAPGTACASEAAMPFASGALPGHHPSPTGAWGGQPEPAPSLPGGRPFL